MSSTDNSPDKQALRELIREHYKKKDYVGWFEALYSGAGRDTGKIPWADRRPNANLIAWLDREQIRGQGRSAVVVGCGLGDDAELLARHGFKVTAFDVSSSAIEWAKQRFPRTSVTYAQADLFNLPAEWVGGFEFVFEAYTIQALPQLVRNQAIDAVASLCKPGGEVLVICRARGDDEPTEEVPFPVSPAEMARFDSGGLRRMAFEDFFDGQDPPVRRFRVLYQRASG